MKPEVVYTKAAPETGFWERVESPIARGLECALDAMAWIPR